MSDAVGVVLSPSVDIRTDGGGVETLDRIPGMFCPSCGTKGKIWSERSGDYYAGELMYCLHCGKGMYEPNVHDLESMWADKLELLRKAVRHE